jgi:glutaredoxin
MQQKVGIKQALADALAGNIGVAAEDEILANCLKMASSEPVFIFTWSNSPACKKAREALDLIGAKYGVKELDKPFEEGNPIRAVLGRHVGRPSVPIVFIGGKYVGGYSDGPNDMAPGLITLAFTGKLRPLLAEAGSIESV